MKSFLGSSLVVGLCCVLFAINEVAYGDDGNGYLRYPLRVGLFGEGRPIYGIYRFKNELYVARDSTPHLEVYDAIGGNVLLSNRTVPGLKAPYDLVGTAGNHKIYITDYYDAANVTVSSIKAEHHTKFSLSEDFTVVALAPTSGDSDLVVTCSQTQKIKEFKHDGDIVREVPLTSIFQPRHSIKFKDGYVMCHGYGNDQLHRVCTVDTTGQTKLCFGTTRGTGNANLDVPARVLEDNGNILVADRDNKRVVLLSHEMKFIRELLTSEDGLVGPYRIVVDGAIMYVADNTVENEQAIKGRVLMFRIRK